MIATPVFQPNRFGSGVGRSSVSAGIAADNVADRARIQFKLESLSGLFGGFTAV
jgi:hypothetical protein